VVGIFMYFAIKNITKRSASAFDFTFNNLFKQRVCGIVRTGHVSIRVFCCRISLLSMQRAKSCLAGTQQEALRYRPHSITINLLNMNKLQSCEVAPLKEGSLYIAFIINTVVDYAITFSRIMVKCHSN
jgi:hypothetical protein